MLVVGTYTVSCGKHLAHWCALGERGKLALASALCFAALISQTYHRHPGRLDSKPRPLLKGL